MRAAGTRAELEGCAGTHVRPARAGAEVLLWVAASGSPRVLDSTCSRCSTLEYELVSFGGSYRVRRMDRVRREVSVTAASLRRREADDLWRRILAGAAR